MSIGSLLLIQNIFGTFTNALNSGNILIQIIALIIYAIIIAIILSLFDYLFGWLERKVIGRIHGRRGPTYVGKFGLLQNMADIIKLLAKQKVNPARADKLLLTITPQILLSFSVFIVLLLPFSPFLQATNLGFGLLIVFVILAFMPILIFVVGFASGNKFSDISAQRSVLILLSYELPTLIVVASIALFSGSYNIQGIISSQSSYYLAIFMPIGFIVFFITMLAELERPPFDLREADSELIAGWLTDVSAPYYTIALFVDYTRVFLGSLLISILFLGGWLGPILPPIMWLLLKASLVAFAIIIIRATTFRMRIDRILRFGWLWLLPLSLINLIITYIIYIR